MAAARTIRSVEPGLVARRSFYWLDGPAVRFTAAGFAIMGNFEDALYCWRAAIAAGTDDARALLLASGSGALGVRLADDALEARWSAGEQGVDCAVASPEVRTLPAAVSLVWRAAALWVGLLALLTIAGWLGR
jgi:adenosylcobinamide-phosphate synthase